MEALTENSPTDDLMKACKEIDNYTDGAMRPVYETLKKHRKKGIAIVRRVNTPSKHRALYIFRSNKIGVKDMGALIVDGSEGTSLAFKVDAMTKDSTKHGELLVLRSHAINRYIERHGFEGTFEQCQEYIFMNLAVNPQTVDEYTGEVFAYFNQGIFIGKYEDNRCTFYTWVKNTQLYSRQRLISRRLQKKLELYMVELTKH